MGGHAPLAGLSLPRPSAHNHPPRVLPTLRLRSVMAPSIVGLDLSLSSTGVATADAAAITLKPKSKGMERLAWLREQIGRYLWHNHQWIDLVAVEQYSFGTARQQSHAHALGELGGVIRMMLWENGVPWVDIAPATVKKYAAGTGAAKKEQVLVAAVKRLGYDGSSTDEADALWLRAAALDAYGYPVVQMPAAHRAALAAVQWPALGEAGAA